MQSASINAVRACPSPVLKKGLGISNSSDKRDPNFSVVLLSALRSLLADSPQPLIVWQSIMFKKKQKRGAENDQAFCGTFRVFIMP